MRVEIGRQDSAAVVAGISGDDEAACCVGEDPSGT